VREGPAPQKLEKISSQHPARKEATWRRKKKEGRVGRNDQRAESELFSKKKIVVV
jgi:hypothetical protein